MERFGLAEGSTRMLMRFYPAPKGTTGNTLGILKNKQEKNE